MEGDGNKVQIYTGGKSAVITYLFSITFVTGGQKQTMDGRDMLFLVKTGRKWQVVAGQFSPDPKGSRRHFRCQINSIACVNKKPDRY